MATKDFTHLHVHTEYSMLDGAARLGDLFTHAKELGMKSMATSDHGFLFGAFDFWRQAKAHDIKPIIGVEAYLTPGTHRTDRSRVRWGDGSRDDVSGGGAYTHMTMWAETTEGMHNLFRASSIASLEGQLYKPRMDREVLQTYSKGLIATTGCPSGEVQTRLRLGQFDEAVQAASEFRDIFGKDNFYCEVMDHGLDIERNVQEDLHRLAKKLNLPFVATNDLHYTRQEDHTAHAALLCVQSGSTLTDPKRFKFDADNFYLRSPEEMYSIFGDIPGACENTLEIAERCNVEFNTKANYMPNFPVPEGENEESWFVKEVEKGLHYRFPQGIPDVVRKQAEYEVGVITSMGFPGYFLVVADFINWAKRNGIRVGPGRGSGAGSMVAYAMRITDLNPLDHDLIFERFLNPDRVSMPDFDVDFDDRRRGEVIDYVTEKYGEEKVAQIVTFGTIKAKQALKDASRVMDQPYSVGERLTKAMPPDVMGKNIALANVYNEEDKRYAEAADLRALIEDPVDKIYGQVFETAKGLEGLKRQWGVHAAGVIMSSKDLVDVIPVMRREADGQVITQFDYPTCEGLGLIKMDFLGLRNLTIISDAVENIKSNRGIDLDLESLPLDDPESYRLLARGDTLGVFQLDGGPMRSLLKLMEPEEFEHISAVLALYRPGPMGANSHTNYALRKNGKQEIEPIHPELEEPLKDILDTTYGLIVYQEQVMAIAQKVANYTLGEADLLRRAMGKKKKAELDKQYATFHDGMISNGYSEGAIKALWDILLPFSDYAFNKAHTAAYGLVSYWTAYLKAHYPQEYMAALLTSQKDNKDKLAVYLGECRHMDITVLPPDVNASRAQFSADGEDIRFGLAAVRNVGLNVVDAIVTARESKGEFASFEDSLDKVPAVVCNKRTIDALIKAGAFDSLGHTRRSLQACHEDFVDEVIGVKRNEAAGQFDLFASLMGGPDDADDSPFGNGPVFSSDVPNLPEWDKKDKLAYERDMLGLYVSDHPLMGLEGLLGKLADKEISELHENDELPDGAMVTIAGLITSLTRKTTKQGNLWAIAQVEDLAGSVEVLFFPQTYQTVSTMLAPDTVVTVRGRLNRRDGQVALYAQEMTIPDISSAAHEAVLITLPTNRCTGPLVEQFKDVLTKHPGGGNRG
ncbi:DNA polymerase III subunit alpha [Rothia mucilaginosa]|uniref:DNA polymerase III subunit alpha n=1 Tax=Rothia mucilaginosa TaxID=43675 RepID=UPI0026EF84BA|nr:DNA polymerase III subunit alpha [Rothia mucilaginosa]